MVGRNLPALVADAVEVERSVAGWLLRVAGCREGVEVEDVSVELRHDCEVDARPDLIVDLTMSDGSVERVAVIVRVELPVPERDSLPDEAPVRSVVIAPAGHLRQQRSAVSTHDGSISFEDLADRIEAGFVGLSDSETERWLWRAQVLREGEPGQGFAPTRALREQLAGLVTEHLGADASVGNMDKPGAGWVDLEVAAGAFNWKLRTAGSVDFQLVDRPDDTAAAVVGAQEQLGRLPGGWEITADGSGNVVLRARMIRPVSFHDMVSEHELSSCAVEAVGHALDAVDGLTDWLGSRSLDDLRRSMGSSDFGGWVLQCNPKKWRLDDFLDDGNTVLDIEDWNVKRYRDRIAAGQKVALWLTGPKGGVVALGHTTGEVVAGRSDGYWVDERNDQEFVPIELTVDLMDEPIGRAELEKDPVFADASIIKQAFAGNPHELSVDQWAVLERCLAERNRDTGADATDQWVDVDGSRWNRSMAEQVVQLCSDHEGLMAMLRLLASESPRVVGYGEVAQAIGDDTDDRRRTKTLLSTFSKRLFAHFDAPIWPMVMHHDRKAPRGEQFSYEMPRQIADWILDRLR